MRIKHLLKELQKNAANLKIVDENGAKVIFSMNQDNKVMIVKHPTDKSALKSVTTDQLANTLITAIILDETVAGWRVVDEAGQTITRMKTYSRQHAEIKLSDSLFIQKRIIMATEIGCLPHEIVRDLYDQGFLPEEVDKAGSDRKISEEYELYYNKKENL